MKKEIGLYVHIPFCKSKCSYCDFCSFAGCDNKIDDYLAALKKEMELYKKVTEDCVIKTVFIGGGTPTYLDSDKLVDLIKTIKENFNVKKDAEFTVECNPGTLEHKKLVALNKAGVNRLSIGLQSANDKTLETIGRIHTFDEFKKNLEDARNVGFDNINADLMFSLPNETLEDIKNTIDEVLKLNLEHISAYSLIIEEGTKMCEMAESGEYRFPDEDEDREIYYYVCDKLAEAGYHQYEISNFAKPGYESKHNTIYWKAEEYLGLGLAAHSYFNDYRFGNTEDMNRYITRIMNENKIAFLNGKKEKETTDDKKAEFMFLGLRMLDGIDINEFENKFGINIFAQYPVLCEMLEDEVLEQNENIIKLTRRGIDVSNVLFAEFII